MLTFQQSIFRNKNVCQFYSLLATKNESSKCNKLKFTVVYELISLHIFGPEKTRTRMFISTIEPLSSVGGL